MTNRVKFIYLFTIIFSQTFIGCSNDDNTGVRYDSITGTYRLLNILTDNVSGEIIVPTTDCDLLSTLEIKSNKTFVITDHNFDDDDDCSDTEIITGTWEVDYSSYNKFRGYFIYDDSGRIADAIDHSGVSGIINHPAENTFKIAYPATDENGQEILNNDGNIIYVSIYWGKIID